MGKSLDGTPEQRSDEMSSVSDSAAERLFARRFPTVTLDYFHAQRRGRPTYVVSRHTLHIIGAATEMVRLGLLNEDMIPPGRTRRHCGRFGSEGNGSTWTVVRLKGAQLKAYFEIMGDDQDEAYYRKGTYRDDFPADHPLQLFHPRHWPFGDAPELRAYFEHTRADARNVVSSTLALLRRNLGCMSRYGYSVHPTDRARMQQIVSECEDHLLAVFDGARVISDQAPQLRLVSRTHEGDDHG